MVEPKMSFLKILAKFFRKFKFKPKVIKTLTWIITQIFKMRWEMIVFYDLKINRF